MFFLKLSLALMFIAIGVAGITNYNSDFAQFGRSVGKVFGKSNDVLPLIFAIIQLLAGVLLLVSLFAAIPENILSISLIVIFVVWAINIVMAFFLNDIFKPDFIIWLSRVSPQLVILTAVWIVFRMKE